MRSRSVSLPHPAERFRTAATLSAITLAAVILLLAATSRAGGIIQGTISIGNARVVEGDTGSVQMRFKVTATGPLCAPVSVDYATHDGSAAADSLDFTPANGTLALTAIQPVYGRTWVAPGPGYIADIVSAPNGDVYALDEVNGLVLRYHNDGSFVQSWGGLGSGPGQFATPLGLGVDASSNVYVADTENLRVQKFDAAGTYLSQLVLPGEPGPATRPLDVALDAAGNAYVSAFGAISKFDAGGNYLMQWGPGGPRPFSIGVGLNGNVFASVADTNGTVSVVHVFEPDSTPVATWGAASTAGQVSGLARLAFDGCGHVFIDSGDRISVADENGTWLSEWSELPAGSIVLEQTNAMAVDAAGRAFVVGGGSATIVQYDLERSGWVTVAVHGDASFEPDEIFTVDLSNPVNAGLVGGSGTGTIRNDDSHVGPNLVGNPDFESSLAGWVPTSYNTLTLSANAHGGSWAALVTAPDSIRSFGLNDSPDWIAAADSDWARYRFSAWVRSATGTGTVRLKVREYHGIDFQGTTQTSSVPIDGTWRRLVLSVLTVFQGSHFDMQVLMSPAVPNAAFLVDDVAIERLLDDVPPIVTVPDDIAWGWQRQMQVPVTARDPDGDVIRSLTADTSNLPGGNDAAFAVTSDRTSGVFSWTPGAAAARIDPFSVVFTARNAFTITDSLLIHVSHNLAGNSTFESGTQGWKGNANATLEQISPGRTGGHAVRVTNTNGTINFGINDSPDWITSFGVGTIYDYSAWVRAAVDTLPTWLWIREYGPGGSLINSETSEHVPVSEDWVNLRHRYYAHALNSSIDFLVMRAGQVTGDQFDIDDVHIASDTIPTSGVPEVKGGSVQALMAPNPMRAEGSLRFALSRSGPLRAEVLDVTGRVVRVIANDRTAAAGTHVWTLKARDDRGRTLPAGVYFYRIRTNDGARSGRFVILN